MKLNKAPSQTVSGLRIKICPSGIAFKFNVNKEVKEMKRVNKQTGFTIIELVVVILLLGILTATALPRFMDVTDEAHAAVVDGLLGGLGTSSAMFHAQWVALGQPTIVTDYASMRANAAGYPVGIVNRTLETTQDCLDIFRTFLQPGGRPSIIAANTTTGAALLQGSITGTTFANVEFAARKATASLCQYAYVGQFKRAIDGDVPVLIYNAATGELTRGTAL